MLFLLWGWVVRRQVRELVQQHGLRKWALIAAALQGKTQKQVYARWRDYLQVSTRDFTRSTSPHV